MDRELAHVLKRFSQYYSTAKFAIPEIERREFGAGIEKKIDSRHMAFQSEQEFRAFLVNNTPLFVSHSVAYYGLPKATPMERKDWLGADLVFDLDFEAEGKYLAMADFAKIREDTVRLIEDFLIPDFGVPERQISANFSGNRGFHVHVRDPRFRQLRADERREIIEYVKGSGLKYEAFFEEDPAIRGKWKGPLPSQGGYAGRLAKKVLAILESEPARLSAIFRDGRERDRFADGIRAGNWSLRSRTPGVERKLREIAETELPMRTVNIDSGVTQDPTKLIRVPDSIHGGTGMCARTMDLRSLHGFEPMHMALALSERPVRIAAIEDIPEMEMGNRTQEKIGKGQEKEVPEYLAFYLKLKGSARLLI